MNKTETILFRLTPVMKIKLQASAKKNQRSTSNMVTFIIEKYLKAKQKTTIHVL